MGLVVNDGDTSNASTIYTFEAKPSRMTYYKRDIVSYSTKRNVGKVGKNASLINGNFYQILRVD